MVKRPRGSAVPASLTIWGPRLVRGGLLMRGFMWIHDDRRDRWYISCCDEARHTTSVHLIYLSFLSTIASTPTHPSSSLIRISPSRT